MSTKDQARAQLASATVISGDVSYEPVATAVASPTVFDRPIRTVNEEFSSIPEASNLAWEDDFFDDDDDVVAAFDFDYETMASFYNSVGWLSYAVTFVYPPLFWFATFCGTPCFLNRNVAWSVNAQHVAITRDGIRFVRDKRRTCWGMPCTDAGKSSRTVPFDKITDCDLEEPAGNTCLCILNVLSKVNIDTASSSAPSHELQISGLKDPHGFKKLVWAMKRSQSNLSSSGLVPQALEMAERSAAGSKTDEGVSSLLREIRDELRQNNALLHSMKEDTASQPNESEVDDTPPPTNPEIV